MLIPNVMNGFEKSITFSRSAVMVSPATARSAFWRERRAERIRTLSLGKQQSPARATQDTRSWRMDVSSLWGCVCCRANPRLRGNSVLLVMPTS